MDKKLESYYIELFIDIRKLAPGSNKSTQKVLSYIKNLPDNPTIIDVGCGTGRQTINLAKATNGKIYALDIIQAYLDRIIENAKKEGLENKIETINKSMDAMDFNNEFFDVIWAEASIYVMGREKALKEWRKFLKPKGYIMFSDVIWLTDNPPDEVKKHWEQDYPMMTNNEQIIETIKTLDYDLIGSFLSSESDWWEMYEPLEERVKELKKKYHDDEDWIKFLDSNQKEINIYRKYSDYYGMSYYIIQKM